MNSNVRPPMTTSWRHVPDRTLDYFDLLSEVLLRQELSGEISLPDLRSGPELFLYSDYSGSHRDSRYETYCFLLVNPLSLPTWHQHRIQVRRRLLGSRRMAFKNLSDTKRAQALAPFLEAPTQLEGLVATFAISKVIPTLFPRPEAPPDNEFVQLLASWKPAVQERVLRVASLACFLVAGLSGPAQNLYWYTDEDDIVGNRRLGEAFVKLFSHAAGHFVRDPIGRFELRTTHHDPGEQLIEDLVSVPDLVAGAITEWFSLIPRTTVGAAATSGRQSVLPASLSNKSRRVLQWLGRPPTGTLRAVTYIVEPESPVRMVWRALTFPT